MGGGWGTAKGSVGWSGWGCAGAERGPSLPEPPALRAPALGGGLPGRLGNDHTGRLLQIKLQIKENTVRMLRKRRGSAEKQDFLCVVRVENSEGWFWLWVLAKVPPKVGVATSSPDFDFFSCPTCELNFKHTVMYLRLFRVYVFQFASALLKLLSGSFILELFSSDLGA